VPAATEKTKMGDAGEGLIDADSRIQERMEELEREREASRAAVVRNPQEVQALESLRLARVELQRQLAATTHARRREQLQQAIADVERRMGDVQARLG
jgi:predicted  nucleic acid-binding Zn-ribbon protein